MRSLGRALPIAAAACGVVGLGLSSDGPVKTVSYRTAGSLSIPADVHLPAGPGPLPVVLWIHGGALVFGDRGMLPAEQRERYLAAGFAVVAIDYRLAPETKLDGILEDLDAALDAHPGARALYMQASETSTCVQHPVADIAVLTRERPTLLVVDGITAVGVVELPMDRLGIDVLITGSQKALMLPPGLALLALSPRAWEATEREGLPRFYFDLKKERKGVAEKSTDWTPAISLIQGLRVALDMRRREGWPNVYARQARLARATRAGATALGLDLLAKTASCASWGRKTFRRAARCWSFPTTRA